MISHNRTHSDKGPPCVLKRLFNVTEIRPPGAVEMPVKKLTEENRPLVAISEPERKTSKKTGKQKHISSLVGFMLHTQSSVCL
jgi:hypothetical protein